MTSPFSLARTPKDLTVVFAPNPMDHKSWETYDNVKSLGRFLLDVVGPRYNGRFPSSAKIYHETITKDHDVTPATKAALPSLEKLRGTVYVVVWPSDPGTIAVGILVNVGIALVAAGIKAAFFNDRPRETAARRIPRGSPNNLPGDRLNSDRVMQRIPDIYGEVKSTPDLIQYPYIHYENNLQIETCLMCIGRGEYVVNANDIYEGKTPISNIPGSSVAIYPPGEVPGSGTPQLQVGDPITDPVYIVIPCKEVTGESLLAPNNTFVAGDEEWTEVTREFEQFWFDTSDDSSGMPSIPPRGPIFSKVSAGVGRIEIDFTYSPTLGVDEVLDQFQVGDAVGLDWIGSTVIGDHRHRGGVSVHRFWLREGDMSVVPDLQLLPETIDDDHYVITDIVQGTGVGGETIVTIDLAIPASKEANWDMIALFNDGSWADDAPGSDLSTLYVPAGSIVNRAFILYKLNFRQGPFFIPDPNMEEVHLNFIAPEGLWADDGNRQTAYGTHYDDVTGERVGGIEIIIELTPADESGVAIVGSTKEVFSHSMRGSASRRDFIGETVRLTRPVGTGWGAGENAGFLVACYRATLQYWRKDLPTWKQPVSIGDTTDDDFELPRNWAAMLTPALPSILWTFQPNGDAPGIESTLPLYQSTWSTFADDIKWTHCYSVSRAKYRAGNISLGNITDMGNVTLVHSRLAQIRNNTPRDIEKRLNMIVARKTGFWDGSEWQPTPLLATYRAIDMLFEMMLDPKIGNMEEDDIDFAGISAAFDQVSDHFIEGNITRFDHTFDSENDSLEDMLSAVGDSCFLTLYRQGNIMKAKADISQPDATLMFNHRNKVPGTEQHDVEFGTREEDYDGVEVEYTDTGDDQIKVYGIPAPGQLRNPLKVRVAGLRTKEKAIVHAWRAYNRLQYQNYSIQFDGCEESALALVKDKVLVSPGYRPDFQDGDIVEIDGLTVYTSQEVELLPSEDYTLFIQDVDGTVAPIPVVNTDGPTANSLILDGALPSGLIIDPEAGIFPRYILNRHMDSEPIAYHIQETRFKNPGVYSITATNYTEGYYFNDAIRLFLPFDPSSGYPPVLLFDDRSPYEFEWEAFGPVSVIPDDSTPVDERRGNIFWAFDTTGFLRYEDFQLTGSVSYTWACWIHTTTLADVFFFDSDNLTIEGTSAGDLRILHDSVEVASDTGVITTGTWQHFAVTMDQDTNILKTFVNGQRTGIAIDVPGFTTFTGASVLVGVLRADMYRFYRTAKSEEFIKELYLRERVVV